MSSHIVKLGNINDIALVPITDPNVSDRELYPRMRLYIDRASCDLKSSKEIPQSITLFKSPVLMMREISCVSLLAIYPLRA